MAEYWYFNEAFAEEASSYFLERPEPVIVMDFTIGERDFVNAGNASSQIKMALKRLGVDHDILRRIAIASYEAEINETAHARGGEITGNIYPEFVVIKFYDKGPGMKDIEQSMVPGFSTADEQVREMGFGAGLGLPNIKKNVDVLHIDSEEGGRTLLEFMIFFRKKS
ncbi:MAG: ATP-binding protein [Candidatus Cloacimonetes bacterium]|nr:ATP-binding protein [Candidatus Cloacimonadota bacterium]